MRIEIEATEKTTRLDGVEVRVWEGVTEGGVKCFVFVHRIAVKAADDCAQFERELKEKLPPGRYVPLVHIL